MMRNSWLVLLPEDFYFQFHYYLLTNDYLQLLHTSKQYYQAIKKKSMYYLLSSGYSYRFVCDTEFRNRLESNVVSPLKQIGLNFRDSVEFPLFSFPLQVHSITFHSSRNLSHEELEYLHEIEEIAGITGTIPFGFTRIKSLSLASYIPNPDVEEITKRRFMKHLDSLSLSPCSQLPKFLFQTFTSMRSLRLYYYSEDINIGSLGPKQLLLLSNFSGLTLRLNPDFSQIKTLVLENCSNIEDFRPLYGIYDLTLGGSTLLRCKDISRLGKHHKLKIWQEHLTNLVGYEILSTVSHVTLEHCDIRDLSVLSQAEEVSLVHCPEITNLSPLSSVRSAVSINFCDNVVDINPLRGIPHVAVRNLPAVEQFDKLGHHKSLHIEHTGYALARWDFLCHIDHLTIEDLYLNPIYDHDVFQSSLFRSLNSIRIFYCPYLIHVYGLEEVPSVTLEDCKNIESIFGLGKNREVTLIKCPKIRNVRYLISVPIVTIRNCHNILDLDSIQAVPRLKICND